MKRKAEYVHGERRAGRSERLQFLGSKHGLKGFHQGRQHYRQLDVVGKPAQIFQRVRNTLEKMRLALIESTEPVGAKSLHDAHIDIRIVMLHECGSIELDKAAEAVEVIVE